MIGFWPPNTIGPRPPNMIGRRPLNMIACHLQLAPLTDPTTGKPQDRTEHTHTGAGIRNVTKSVPVDLRSATVHGVGIVNIALSNKIKSLDAFGDLIGHLNQSVTFVWLVGW